MSKSLWPSEEHYVLFLGYVVKACCEKHKVEINFWYSPSKIPQPKFIIDGIGFDADELYDEKISETLANQAKETVKRTKNQHSLRDRHPSTT